MIQLRDVTKAYRTKKGLHVVLDRLTCDIATNQNLGILGKNGAGKSTLLRILAGIEQPDAGTITRQGKISWPIGFSGGFAGSLTGEENCRFAARIYGLPVDDVVEYARDFAEIGDYFFMPARTYSSGMRARLAFGLSMAIDFDYYLVDEVTAVGDREFQERCREAFRERNERASVIIVSHHVKTIKEYCDRVAVLKAGTVRIYDDLEQAASEYQA